MRASFCIVLLALLFLPLPLYTWDNGLLLDLSAEYNDFGMNSDKLDNLQFTGAAIPWFSTPLGAGKDIYISVGITAEYQYQDWTFIPELLRTELRFLFDNDSILTAGRTQYTDPLGFVANGLFDGVQYSMDAGDGFFNAGLFYTGLLYKKNASITMTEHDLISYRTELDYSDFSNTYFAPRRLVAAVNWENPGLAEYIMFNAALIGQFDLGDDSNFHSYYLMAKAAVPVKNFVFELGACAELIDNNSNYQYSFAVEGGIIWYLPTALHDRLMFRGTFSPGVLNDTLVAFVPITTVSQGYILRAKLSGLSILSLDYTARLRQDLTLSVSNSYFILNDMGTYQGVPLGRDGYFLGNELFAQATWSPVSDIRLKLGSGVFIPFLGNADPQGDILWRIELNVIFAVL